MRSRGRGRADVCSYYTAQTFIPEWFVARRGLSTGVCFAGTAVGGLILPFVLNGLLSATSIRNTLLIVVRRVALTSLTSQAPVCGGIILAVAPFLKPRAPRLTGPRAGRRDRQAGTPVLQLLRDRSFLLFTLANFLQGLGYCARSQPTSLTRQSSLRYICRVRLPTGAVADRPAFASSLNLGHAEGTATVVAINAASVVSFVASQ